LLAFCVDFMKLGKFWRMMDSWACLSPIPKPGLSIGMTRKIFSEVYGKIVPKKTPKVDFHDILIHRLYIYIILEY
jgi:hypothetical protein